jgi:hypothetical protein
MKIGDLCRGLCLIFLIKLLNKKYSDGMARAYKQLNYFRSGKLTNPQEGFMG